MLTLKIMLFSLAHMYIASKSYCCRFETRWSLTTDATLVSSAWFVSVAEFADTGSSEREPKIAIALTEFLGAHHLLPVYIYI